jgi:hypothetical protein
MLRTDARASSALGRPAGCAAPHLDPRLLEHSRLIATSGSRTRRNTRGRSRRHRGLAGPPAGDSANARRHYQSHATHTRGCLRRSGTHWRASRRLEACCAPRRRRRRRTAAGFRPVGVNGDRALGRPESQGWDHHVQPGEVRRGPVDLEVFRRARASREPPSRRPSTPRHGSNAPFHASGHKGAHSEERAPAQSDWRSPLTSG